MTKHEIFQDKVAAQLKTWRNATEALKEKLRQSKSEAAIAYRKQLNDLSIKQGVAQQKLQALQQASDETWGEARSELDNFMAELQRDFDRLKEEIFKAGQEGLSWAKGLTDQHFIESIGWAEGMADKQKVESIGWAEGTAETDPVESKGWTEGYKS